MTTQFKPFSKTQNEIQRVIDCTPQFERNDLHDLLLKAHAEINQLRQGISDSADSYRHFSNSLHGELQEVTGFIPEANVIKIELIADTIRIQARLLDILNTLEG